MVREAAFYPSWNARKNVGQNVVDVMSESLFGFKRMLGAILEPKYLFGFRKAG